MVKSFPRYNLLAEFLDRSWLAGKRTVLGRLGTHTCNLFKITRRVYPQPLDCNLASLVFTLPHVSVSATIQRGIRSVVA